MMKIDEQQQKQKTGLVVLEQMMSGMIADLKLTLFEKHFVKQSLLSVTCDVVVSVFVVVTSCHLVDATIEFF